MGYVSDEEGIDAAMRSLAAHGVCRSSAEQWLHLKPCQHKQRQQLLSSTYRLLEDSPTPATEWGGLRDCERSWAMNFWPGSSRFP
jgi:hypothetical protein